MDSSRVMRDHLPPSTSPDLDEMMCKLSSKPSKTDHQFNKMICRYGPGCTHLLADPTHKEKFWHPKIRKVNDEKIRSHHICNECGYATSSLPDLALHLKRKTAWSNLSLIGCRVNCLIDFKEWHEGYVTQFHKSGKHFVEFRLANERRWMVMKKIAFYIIERPVAHASENTEYKDSGGDGDNLAPIENNWVYCEDISNEFAFAQSVLFKVFGNSVQETGHMTKGHVSITDSDKLVAQQLKISLLYGELLPRGANKAFGAKRLEVYNASSLYDLGMGTGKVVIQAFLQFKNLTRVVGLELSQGRYRLAEDAALRMVHLLGSDNFSVQLNSGSSITITEVAVDNLGRYYERILHLQCANIFDLQDLASVDIVMMETDIPADLHPKLVRLLNSMNEGSRLLTYLDLRKVWDNSPVGFRQLEINRHLSDRYATSWSVQRGHHFYLWIKLSHEHSWTNAAGSDPCSPSGKLSSKSSGRGLDDDGGDYNSNRCFPIRFFGWSDKRKISKKSVADVSLQPSSPVEMDERNSRSDFRSGGSESDMPQSSQSPTASSPIPPQLSISLSSKQDGLPSNSPRQRSARLSPRPSPITESLGLSTNNTIILDAGSNNSRFSPIESFQYGADQENQEQSLSPRSGGDFPDDIRALLRFTPPMVIAENSERAAQSVEANGGKSKRKEKSKSRSSSPRVRRKSGRVKSISASEESAHSSTGDPSTKREEATCLPTVIDSDVAHELGTSEMPDDAILTKNVSNQSISAAVRRPEAMSSSIGNSPSLRNSHLSSSKPISPSEKSRSPARMPARLAEATCVLC